MTDLPARDDDFPADETDALLAALRGLIARAPSPVVRVCLEEALADVAHLTGRDLPGGAEPARAAS